MNNTHTLTRHRDIQTWVSNRSGIPAIRRVPDRFGEVRARLAIHFGRPEAPTSTPSMDDGMSPVSWTAWLAELDRQGLALKVDGDTEFEFVERRTFN